MIARTNSATARDNNFNTSFGDILSRRFCSLEAGDLCAEAQRRTGLEDFVDPEIEPRLSVLVKSIENEANLHPVGRFMAKMHLRDLLEKRLLLTDSWKNSSTESETIQRPIFITGMPRSGSTFLHELMLQDSESRAPLVWEVMFPLPKSPSGERDTNRRIRKASACLWWFRQIAPHADSVHPLRATSPHECVAIHSHALLSHEFAITFRVPTYEAFLNSTDISPAYAWQKRFLQHLQKQSSAKRWVLKAPDHVFSLEALFKIFPDATVIQTHRNPLDVIKSSAQLVEVLRRTFARPQEREQIAEREARALAEGMERITRFRDAHPELANRFLDVHYRQFVADPLGTVRKLYWQLDLPLTDATAERFRSLASHRTRYSRNGKVSNFAELGIDSRSAAQRFEYYCTRFGIHQA